MRHSRIALSVLLLVGTQVHARGGNGGLSFGLEPIVGYERVQKLVPTAHTVDRLVYGGRVTIGFLLLSLEAQYTNSKDTETFTSPDLTTTDTTAKAKVGLRSTLGLTSFARFVARGGVQATQNRHQESTGGVETVNTLEALTYKPYAGAGFKFRLASNISFTAEVVAVFRDFPDMNQNDYETTAGLELKF